MNGSMLQKRGNDLEKILETHLCDLEETNEYESDLENAASNYFQLVDLEKQVAVFKSLSDEKRIKILHLLTLREMCNCELTAATCSSQPNLTYHIKILENAGLVKHRREGKFIYYSLKDDPVTKLILDLLRDLFQSN